METLTFSKENTCTLVVQEEILTSSKLLLEDKTYVVIFDTNVEKLYRESLKKAFASKKVFFLSVRPSEKSKSFFQVNKLLEKLFLLGCDRKTILIAFGGGVVLDLVGFLGSIFLRGIEVQFFPTTLLAMVDATFGGKTAINTSFGKNLIGSFSHPSKIYLDTTFLKTLSKKGIKEGLSEVIKHFIIYDQTLFNSFYLEVKKQKTLGLLVIEKYVYPALEIKKKIVEEDPFDHGKRQILNFGHTFAHALEKVYGYSLSHGQAVVVGILVESYLSMNKNLLSQSSFKKIWEVFSLLGMIPRLKKAIDKQEFLKCLLFDKKNKNGKVHIVLILEIGKCYQENNVFAFPILEDDLTLAFSFLQEKF